MIIKLNDIINGKSTSFEYIEKELESFEIPEGIEIVVTTKENDGSYLVEGQYKAKINVECVRCLKKNNVLIQGNFKGEYLDPKEYSKYLKSLEVNEKFDEKYFEEAVNSEINISELVREYIILDLPEYEICTDGCEDISELEKYSQDDIDPRWQQLLNIEN